MIKVIIMLSVAAAVPVFFVCIWLSSSYHRMNALRNQWDRLRGAIEPGQPDSTKAYHDAVQAYDAARQRFPAKLFASRTSPQE